MLLLLNLFLFFFRDGQFQNAVLELRVNLILGHCLADIKAAGTAAGIPLTADVGCLLYTSFHLESYFFQKF